MGQWSPKKHDSHAALSGVTLAAESFSIMVGTIKIISPPSAWSLRPAQLALQFGGHGWRVRDAVSDLYGIPVDQQPGVLALVAVFTRRDKVVFPLVSACGERSYVIDGVSGGTTVDAGAR